MIDFQTVTKEFRSLITRRQELITFLGSVFAASGVFLENTLQGSLPESLANIKEHIFFFYAMMIVVPSLILALRMARLHAGMTLNGMLYAKLMEDQTFTKKGNVEKASRHNVVGVSYIQFLLADFLAAFSTTILGLTLSLSLPTALVLGLGVFILWNVIYLRFHKNAVAIARKKIAAEDCEGFGPNDWLEHMGASLEDANHGLIGNIGFVGLIIFSVFEVMSGLGGVEKQQLMDIRADQIMRYGPSSYCALMLITCLAGLIINIRLRVAVGHFSLDLDPTDRPFRAFRLTDSFLGYLLLCFFTAVAVHLVLTELAGGLPNSARLGIDGLVLVVIVLAEPITLIIAGRKPRPTGERKLVLVTDAPAKSGEREKPKG